ncbi:hypothetical protein J2128_001388 [Methanomicrobium sp. W14]|nr:hypothetical protein [Methanomicrobium sp. W14]
MFAQPMCTAVAVDPHDQMPPIESCGGHGICG